MNFTPITLPEVEAPLPKATRRTILQHAHEFILAWGTIRPAKEVVYTQLVAHLAVPLAKAYSILVDEEHNDLAGEIAFGKADGQGIDWFRNKWGGTMIAKIFDKTPGVPKGRMLDCYFDYEVSDGPMAPKLEPWKNIDHFCNYMADRAIKLLTDGRLPGQALSYFGIVASDLDGIGIPGYVPPDRDNPVIRKVEPVEIATTGIGFGMQLALGVVG